MGRLFKAQGQVELAKSQLLRGYKIFKSNLGEFHLNTRYTKSILEEGWGDKSSSDVYNE